MSYSLLSKIHNSVWLIEEGSHQALQILAQNILNGNIPRGDFSQERAKHRAYVVSADDHSPSMEARISPKNSNKQNSIAVIPVMDVITLYDQECGPEGTYTKRQYLEASGKNPNIDSVILFIDSPGGDPHAMFDMTNAIFDFKKNYQKPIIAFVGSKAGSAAFGIAAACDEIICSDENSLVGSLGTYTTVVNVVKSMKNEGLEVEIIYAEDSPEKNNESRAVIAGDKKPMLAMLKVYNDRFHSIVKKGRPEAKATEKGDPFKGKTIFAIDALGMNLINAIGNFDIAIKHCTQLKSNYSQTINSMTKFQTTWANIAAFFSNKKEGDDITEAEMVELNTELGTRKTSIDQLTGQITSKDAEIATLTQQLTESKTGSDTLQAALTATETKLDAANAELARRPGTTVTTPRAETETIPETTLKIVSDPVNAMAKEMLGIK